MKKIGMFFSMVTAFLLIGAMPAIAGGTGPYGHFGPAIDFAGGEVQHVAFAGGTGPYGFFGPSEASNVIPGAEVQHFAASGTGPYGSWGPSGMSDWGESHQMANKDECLLVAMNCPKDFSTQEKIDRLNTEISKGTSVYTPEELNTLKGKRDDAYRDLNKGQMNQGY